MPELPEVQATVNYLRERVQGKRITDASVMWHRTIDGTKPATFTRHVSGALIKDVFRRGKFVCLELKASSPLFLLVHLRMSGSLDVISTKNPIAPHDRVVLELENNKSIRFNDTRKFGRIYLAPSVDTVAGNLGVEPLSPDFTPAFLLEGMKKRARITKALLLDQTFIAGLGNIYVDETLWKAGIHPRTRSNRISKARAELLHTAIRDTLTEAISLLGTDFGDNVVHGGMYRPKVYGREGEPCERCTSSIKRIVVGQRGTHFCPKCQA